MEENYDLTNEEREAAIASLEEESLSQSKKRTATEHVEYLDVQVLDDDEEIEYFDDDDDMDETYQPPNKKRPTPSPASSSASSSTKGKKKELEYDMKVAICNQVRNFPSLYQITHQNYSNRAEKDAIWEQISVSLCTKFGPKMTVQKCRKQVD